MGNKKLDINTCSKSELDLLFAKLKSDFANQYPVHALDCRRAYLPVHNVSERVMKEKHVFERLKIRKYAWTKLQLFNFSHFKLFEKWKYK